MMCRREQHSLAGSAIGRVGEARATTHRMHESRQKRATRNAPKQMVSKISIDWPSAVHTPALSALDWPYCSCSVCGLFRCIEEVRTREHPKINIHSKIKSTIFLRGIDYPSVCLALVRAAQVMESLPGAYFSQTATRTPPPPHTRTHAHTHARNGHLASRTAGLVDAVRADELPLRCIETVLPCRRRVDACAARQVSQHLCRARADRSAWQAVHGDEGAAVIAKDRVLRVVVLCRASNEVLQSATRQEVEARRVCRGQDA